MYRLAGLTTVDLEKFKQMMIRCQKRGKDASGAFNQAGDFIKSTVKSEKLVLMSSFDNFLKESVGCKYVVGHCRAATSGDPKKIDNNHPVFNKRKSIFLVHNGTVTCKEFNKYPQHSDTWIFIVGLMSMMDKDRSDDYLSRTMIDAFKKISDDGTNSSVVVVGNRKELVFLKSYGRPLVWQESEGGIVVFGSETSIIHDKDDAMTKKPYESLKSYTHVIIDVKTGEITKGDIKVKIKSYYSSDHDTVEYDKDTATGTWEGWTQADINGRDKYNYDYYERGYYGRGHRHHGQSEQVVVTQGFAPVEFRERTTFSPNRGFVVNGSCFECTAYDMRKDTSNSLEMDMIYCDQSYGFVKMIKMAECKWYPRGFANQ